MTAPPTGNAVRGGSLSPHQRPRGLIAACSEALPSGRVFALGEGKRGKDGAGIPPFTRDPTQLLN